MQLIIPKRNDDLPYQRKEMEALLRDQLLSKNHIALRQLALKDPWKLHPDFYLSAPINVILHWLLDRMIDESLKKDSIKVVGEKLGLAPARLNEVYKIKGFDARGNNDEFMLVYTKLLANFISRKLAMLPADNEGINLVTLNRFIEPDVNGFVPPPVPPGVTPLEVVNFIPGPEVHKPKEMPPIPVRKPRPVKPRLLQNDNDNKQPEMLESMITPATIETILRGITDSISRLEDKFISLEEKYNALDTRIAILTRKA